MALFTGSVCLNKSTVVGKRLHEDRRLALSCLIASILRGTQVIAALL